MSHILKHLLLIVSATFICLSGADAVAQNLFDPVARVNDRVITTYEHSQRIAFMRLLNAPGNLPDVTLEQLINERLQLDAAKQLDLTLDDGELAAGMAEFAARAELDTEKFITAIAGAGVAPETFRDFVLAGLMWRKVARARFGAKVRISEAEIDRAIALTQPGVGVRVLISEIILPANTPASKRASTQRAAELSQITTLPAFASAARRYSVAPSRGRSGRQDWMPLSNLPPAVAAKILPLSPGQVTEPIPVRNAIALFQLRAIEETDAPAPVDVSLEYASFYIAGGRNAATLAEAATIKSKVDTCDDLYGIAKDLPEDRLDREVLPIAEVPTDIALELAKLDDGEVSTALTRSDEQTLVFLMLCGRTRELPEEVSREDIRTQLRNKRLNALVSSYLEELRADAFIEMFDRS